MALADAYLMKTSNVGDFFTALQAGQAPERFTYKFLEQLGFGSSNDRLYIKLLKELAFLDPSGIPTQRYFEFLDQAESQAVVAEAIYEAYADLFTINKKAYEMSASQVANKIKSLTQGKKSEKILKLMSTTFLALCGYADWEGLEKRKALPSNTNEESEATEDVDEAKASALEPAVTLGQGFAAGLHYNIQIHLPESRDPKVYDAIFESLRKHLR